VGLHIEAAQSKHHYNEVQDYDSQGLHTNAGHNASRSHSYNSTLLHHCNYNPQYNEVHRKKMLKDRLGDSLPHSTSNNR